MPGYGGELIVLAVLAVIVALALRSIWKGHKAGGHCSGDCASCAGCSHAKDCAAHRKKAG